MKPFSKVKAPVTAPRSGAVLLLLAALSLGLPTGPAVADGLFLRKGVAAGENGLIAGSRGGVFNGEGQGAFSRGRLVTDGDGNGFAGTATCANGLAGEACRAGTATWSEDGSFTRNLGTEANGENGSLSARRSLSWDDESGLIGARSVDAAGDERSYTGAASLEDGTYNRDGTYTGDEGQSFTVDSTYEKGIGGSRSVTCIDASGAVVACP